MFSLPSSLSLLKVPISSFKKIVPGQNEKSNFSFFLEHPLPWEWKFKKTYFVGCFCLFVCLFVFSSDKGLAFKLKVTETIFIFNFSFFSSDTDEEEMNRLAEAAVSGHSIIKNGKVILH